MTKKIFVIGLGLFLVLGLLHLGVKVHDLEYRLNSLEHAKELRAASANQPAAPSMNLPVAGKIEPTPNEQLIDARYFHRGARGRSDAGVPWDVDRGMMIDGLRRDSQPPYGSDGNMKNEATISGGHLIPPQSQQLEVPPEILQNLRGGR